MYARGDGGGVVRWIRCGSDITHLAKVIYFPMDVVDASLVVVCVICDREWPSRTLDEHFH